MKRPLTFISALLLLSQVAFSQTYTIESSSAQPCGFVELDITASGLPDSLGAISLYIDFNPQELQYLSAKNIYAGFGVNQVTPGRIGLVWSTMNGYGGEQIDGLLATIILHYNGGTAILDWNETLCETVEITDLFNPVTCFYVNGAVTEGSYTYNTYYVDAARPASGNGLSWATAFKTITEATNVSLKPGEHVLIKPGTYNEKVIVKSNGGYSLLPLTGVTLSDTNKITFPSGTSFGCVDLANYPDQYYAYVYRSWNSNNGYYKIIEVNDAQDFIRVEGASFIPEAGSVNNKRKVMAAIGRPVIFKKDPTASESQRVIVDASGLGSIADAFYIGIPGSSPQTAADPCNWNIIEDIDLTAGTNTTNAIKGLHIQNSAYNVFADGKIYSYNGIGAIVSGRSNQNAMYNIIQNNDIYNTPYQGVLLGYTTTSSTFNYSHFNHVLDNDFYLSGAGTLARFDNAVKINYRDTNNVVEGNNFHDFNLYNGNNGAVMVVTKADNTLLYNNIFKNIGKVNTGIYSCIMADTTMKNLYIYNNIIYNEDTVSNGVYAFRLNGRRHTGSKVAYNHVYKIDNAFYLEDNNSGGATIDFGIHNNIISPTVGYFNNVGTTGRFTVTYNLFRSSAGTPYGSGTGNITANPQFMDPDGSNMYGLMLLPASPAIDTGLALSSISVDYFGKQRDAVEPTLGAFEELMEATWTGASSTSWHSNLNWKLGYVPQYYMTIIIPDTGNDPVVSIGNASGKSVNILNGALLRIQSPRQLTLQDD